MVFVYQGAGKKQREDADPCQKNKKCQKLACDIQWCLSRNGYQQSRCTDFVERWESCCEAVRARLAESMKAIENNKDSPSKTKP